eukprot:TRINITY_DN18134_c0_g1_i1.p1 TRINITY_DN18134_c0_g1~~TRINITY_DN18134_c0_g1_i1.p1  ORF type:complete len:227 (+),score=46.59 TRINITY_DN18134_c0_g1_i1:59-739(+)
MGSNASTEKPPSADAAGGKMVSWAGTEVTDGFAKPPDPSILNDISQDDRYADIDFQSVPVRVLESLRKTVEKESLEACRSNHEETISCLKFNTTRPTLCKPLFEEYYSCMRKWREDNDDLYYDLVKQSIDGKLLEKHRNHVKLLEQEWKKRFPDTPMPRAHVPDKRPGATSMYVHEQDKGLVARDLAMQRLNELDAELQGITLEEYTKARHVVTDAKQRNTWAPAF